MAPPPPPALPPLPPLPSASSTSHAHAHLQQLGAPLLAHAGSPATASSASSASSSSSSSSSPSTSSALSLAPAPAPAHRFVRSILVLGASMVGKSALCQRFVHDRYDEAYEPTYENRFVKMLTFKHHDVECVIKDTQGLSEQELFRSEYGLGYHGYMLVYSISSLRSFESVRSINHKLTALLGTSNVPRVLVGAKQDMAFEGARQVSVDMGAELAHQIGSGFVECSAKANHNVEKAFLTLLEEVDKASEVEPTRSMWLADCLRCLQPGGGGGGAGANGVGGAGGGGGGGLDWTLSDDSVWDRAAHMGIVAVTLLSVAALALGASVGFLASTESTEQLAYVLFAFGVLLGVLSLIGMFGVRHSSVDYLFVYAISLAVLALIQMGTFFVLLLVTSLLADLVTPVAIGVAASICLEGAAASVVYVYQYVLRQSMLNSYFTSANRVFPLHYQELGS